MKLKCIGSGSSGNSYALIDNDNKILLLDLGLPEKEIKKAIDFRISDVVGAVVTHSHQDHSKAVEDFEKMGIPVFKPYMDLDNICADENCQLAQKYEDFRIVAFQLPHNGMRNCGFLITVDGQKILYLTDFEYCKYNFKNLNVNHILVECNYQQGLVDRDLPNYEHKIRGHCSLSTCKEFIKVNATDNLQNVILCHLGRETTEPEECVDEVQKIVPQANVCVAERGLEVELRKKGECPF